MYKHLLVPVDGSPLSNATVEQAVVFARTTGARLTFFHALADYAATDQGALLHAVDPQAFADLAAGNAQAITAKAQAAARAVGVPCRSVVRTSDHPHEAILEAAREAGCDLIFMASRGLRGMRGVLYGSVMQSVLRNTTLPVLVAAVQSNVPPSAEQRALAVIRDEHRSMAAVLNALNRVLEEAAQRDGPDIALVGAVLSYFEQFPERLHHPKEESFLFARLRQRTHECNALIEQLQQQHAAGASTMADLQRLYAELRAGRSGALPALGESVQRFTQAQWLHMRAEEGLVLPAASRHLTARDWEEIDAAFGTNGDPRFGADEEESFAQLASRLLNLAAKAVP